ncbi:hypothetical protein [Aurantiacibacter odishensis]|uniref:hypothetical protein n=1 Tax=Aurantiacibacter odishensis TaxID=1155476 RepID=UPI000E71DABA|nr:hypothetical protein [Aurantiacibacter odishensis]
MTFRNLLLLGLSSVALQGCIAAAAIPIVAGGGALVRDTVSDDARADRREQVAVVPPPAPTPAPTSAPAPTPTPALASAQPSEPLRTATPPASTAASTPATGPSTSQQQASLAARPAEPVVVSTLDESRAASAPTVTSAPTLPTASGAAAMPAAEAPAREPATDSAVSDAWAAAREVAASLAPARPAPAQTEPAASDASATMMPERSDEPASSALAASASPAASAAEPPAPAATSSAQAGADLRGYGSLRSYALRTLGEGVPLPSAMLADPTSLQPVRRDCEGNAPTVVIDLDPQGELVPIVGPLRVNTDLARILAELRLRDVQIAWITDRGPIDARAIRDRLVASGLDPDAEDSIYVERYPGETKQARRAALAQTQCVIALAGDERSDFDDLYNFIREPGDARNLELLLGNGWFLIENPVGG